MGVRRWAPILIVIVGLMAIAAVWLTRDQFRDDGPLSAPSALDVEFPIPPGATASWGVILPYNPTTDELTVLEVEPLKVYGLEVLDVVATDSEDGTIINSLGFPPPGFRTQPVEGAHLPPAGDAPGEFQVVVGIRLAEGSTAGGIDQLRLRYEDSSGDRYEVNLPWSLQVT